jgi:acyl transferase domain-containing protein
VAAGRLSYTFGLRGPCAAIDTACSSSLAAAHFAAGEMAQGSCRSAVVAGVKLILTPALSAMFAKAGMLAPDGRCKTLDAAADGYVRAEALAGMLLHRVPAASASAEWGVAVILGSAVNQDGRSSGLTAPNGPAQQEVVRSALAAAGLSAADVSTLQLHGTGTGLGDPIEVGALAAVFAGGSGGSTAGKRQQPLRLASDKSSLGHTEPAAGLTGLLQAISAAAHQAAQPILHLRTPSPHLVSSLPFGGASDGGAISMPRQLHGAPALRRRGGSGGASIVAGVSSFAFQGSNAHLLLAVAPAHAAASAAQSAAQQQAQIWRRSHSYVLPAAHALLHACRAALSCSVCSFAARLSHPLLSFLSDHVVGSAVLIPGAAFLEAALAAGHIFLSGSSDGSSSSELQLGLAGVAILAPLVLEQGSGQELLVSVELTSGAVCVSSSSSNDGAGADHARGSLVRLSSSSSSADPAAPPDVDAVFDRLSARGLRPLDTARLYSDLKAAGLGYGRAFRRLRGAKSGADAAASRLEQLADDPGTYHIHPATLDAAFQLGAAVGSAAASAGATFVPASVALFAPGAAPAQHTGCATAVATDAAASSSQQSLLRDLQISHGGRLACCVEGLESRAVSPQALIAAAAAKAGPRGQAKAASGGRKQQQEEDEVDADLLYAISWAAEEPDSATGLDQAAAALLAPAVAGKAGTAAAAANAVQLLQGVLASDHSNPAPAGVQLRIPSANTGSCLPLVAGAASAAEQATWGMLRTVAQEAAGLISVSADHGSTYSRYPSASGFRLLPPHHQSHQSLPFDGYGSTSISGTSFAPRMVRSTALVPSASHHLVPSPRGALGNLMPVAVDVGSRLGAGQLMLSVKAVGLNFRDVLNVSCL